jgi:Amt family ammonium transporter
MSDNPLVISSLAFLVPLGYALIGMGGLPAERARHAALSVLAALGLAGLGYLGAGFAFQFGGIGLAYALPGLEELAWEWSALGPSWGAGWGMAGLAGWAMTGPAATPAAYLLALANLPWVTTAALIPLMSLRGRIPAWAAGLLGLLMGALIYPVAGNWIWGGGWLANLGANLGQGHGLVDVGGAGLIHLLGAAVTLAGILTFTGRTVSPVQPGEPVPLPPVHLPVLAVFGAGLLLAGGPAWVAANPLLAGASLDLARTTLNWTLAAAGAALLPLLYTWFVAGTADPLMATRGLAAGTVAVAAVAPFIPPWSAFAIGSAIGLLSPLSIFTVEHVLHWDDPTASLTVHGLAGALGLLAVGLFADGTAGLGWNGIGPETYLGVAGQGITGLLAAPGFRPDWPGQMQAQLVGLAALALFGFFAAWLATAPLALASALLRRRARALAAQEPAPVPTLLVGADPVPPDTGTTGTNE